MKAIKFKGHNAVLAEDQPQYTPLPVCVECTPEGSMVSCFKLSWLERIKLLFSGKLFFRQLTFGQPFQPVAPLTEWHDGRCKNCGGLIGDHKAKHGFVCPSKLN